jgi:hypothetical protein
MSLRRRGWSGELCNSLLHNKGKSDYCGRHELLLNLAGDGADLRLADFIPGEVRRIEEDRDTPEVSSAIQFRCSSSKYIPNLGQ